MKFLVSLGEKLRKLGKKGKAMLFTAIATVTTCAIPCVASADATMDDAVSTVQTKFSDLITTLVPVIVSILGSGLVIFGIFALVKLAKKIFGKVAG